MAGYTDRSDPGDTAVMSWIVAGMASAGAVWVGWMLGWTWNFDMDDPEFNPMILIVVLLTAVAAWHVVKALRWRARAVAFGGADIAIHGRTPVPMGQPLKGVLRFDRPVSPTGEWELQLSCHDIHETHDTRDSSSSPYRQDAYPVWSSTIRLPADSDTAAGLPFSFQLPASVGPKPVRPLERKSAYFSFTASVNIPGFRSVTSHNAPPVARRWTLRVTAPTDGPVFEAAFPIPIEV